MARLMAFPTALVLVLGKPVGRLETSGLAAAMEFLPIGLPQPISPGEWGNTPASIQTLVKALLAKHAGDDQGIVTLLAQIQREKALNRVVQAIRNSLDLDTVFATATAEAAQLMAPLDCYVSQYVAEADLWRTVAEYRHDASLPPTLGFEIPDAGNPFSAQLRRLEMVCLDDTDAIDDEVNRSVARTTPGAWLLTPIAVDGQIWGSFALVAHQRPFSWGSGQIELSQAIAHQLEVAIQQANLYRQVQLELKERRRVETALQESQARGQAVAANLPGVMYGYCLRPDGSEQFTYISSGFREIYDFEPEVVLEDAGVMWRTLHPDDVASLQQSIEVSRRHLETWRVKYRAITATGQIK